MLILNTGIILPTNHGALWFPTVRQSHACLHRRVGSFLNTAWLSDLTQVISNLEGQVSPNEERVVLIPRAFLYVFKARGSEHFVMSQSVKRMVLWYKGGSCETGREGERRN